jgi:hypothetical protein
MIDQDKADNAIVNLFASLPPTIADRLKQKYDADRAQFMQVVQDMMPSNEPSYWASRSCTKCHGRGILGTVTKPSGEKVVPACSCTSKNYKKWLVTVRQFYNALKEQGHETD